jgi:uncharacterized integral membrane protein
VNQPQSAPAESSGSKLGAGAIASLAGGGLLVVFMLQNREDVNIDFLVWGFTWPLWLVILVSAVLGGLVWIGAGVVRRHRRRKERRAER